MKFSLRDYIDRSHEPGEESSLIDFVHVTWLLGSHSTEIESKASVGAVSAFYVTRTKACRLINELSASFI